MYIKELLDLLFFGKVILVLVFIYFYMILFIQNGGVNVILGYDIKIIIFNILVEDIIGNKIEN